MTTASTPAYVASPAAARSRRQMPPAVTFLFRRVAAGVVTLLVVSALIFAGTNLLPGNAARAILGQRATPASVAALDKQLGLDRSLPDRYASWLGGFVHGDLGKSAAGVANQDSLHSSVASLIGKPLLNSAILALITVLIVVPLSLLIGVYAATRIGTRRDSAISLGSLSLVSLPEFVTGALLIALFAGELGWLPSVSLVAPGEGVLSTPNILVLPVVTLLAASLAYTVRFIRASVADVLRADYVTAARLGGVNGHRVLWRYAVRNALAPTIQVIAQTMQWLVGGIVVTETVFGYPGIGQALVNAVTVRDITVVQSIALILAAFYILLNIVADLMVTLLVPKLRTSR